MSRDHKRQSKLYAREQRRLAYQRRHEPPANDASDILEHLLQAVEESRTDDEAQEHLASIREATTRRILADVRPADIIATAIERAAFSPGAKDTDKEVKALLDAARHGKGTAEDETSLCAGDIPQAAPYACSRVADVILNRLEARYGTEAGRIIATTYAAAQKPLPMSLPVSVLASVVLEECAAICEPTTYERMSVEEVQAAAREVYAEVRGLLRAELNELEDDDALTRYEGLRFGRVDGVRHEQPVTYKANFEEGKHPREDDGRFKSGSGSKGKAEGKAEGKATPSKASKPHASPASPHAPGTAKPKRPTVDDVHDHIERIKHNATPADVAELASHMQQMTVKELHELKKRHGLRAGGRKAELAKKIAHRATMKVKNRERWSREARKRGLRPADLHATVKMFRSVHEETRAEIVSALKMARKSYTHHTNGGQLSRSLKPFREGTGDYNSISSWDVISRSVSNEWPNLFVGMDDLEKMQALYDLVAAGKPPRLSQDDIYETALANLEADGVPEKVKRLPKGDAHEDGLFDDSGPSGEGDDFVPFAKGVEEDNDVNEYIAAMMEHADNQDMVEAIAELHAEDEEEADEDHFPPHQAAIEKIRKWMEEVVRQRVYEE